MRMDPSRGESAAEFLARATVRELTEVLRDYGEERSAQSIARAVAAARAHEPVVGTRQLAALVAQAIGTRTRGDWRQDPATRTFQALRIFVNRELSELTMALPAVVAALRPGAAWPSSASIPSRTASSSSSWLARRGRTPAIPRSRGWPFARTRCRARRSRWSAAPSSHRRPRSSAIRARAAQCCASPSARRTHCPSAGRRGTWRPRRDPRECRAPRPPRRVRAVAGDVAATRPAGFSWNWNASRPRAARWKPSTASCS